MRFLSQHFMHCRKGAYKCVANWWELYGVLDGSCAAPFRERTPLPYHQQWQGWRERPHQRSALQAPLGKASSSVDGAPPFGIVAAC